MVTRRYLLEITAATQKLFPNKYLTSHVLETSNSSSSSSSRRSLYWSWTKKKKKKIRTRARVKENTHTDRLREIKRSLVTLDLRNEYYWLSSKHENVLPLRRHLFFCFFSRFRLAQISVSRTTQHRALYTALASDRCCRALFDRSVVRDKSMQVLLLLRSFVVVLVSALPSLSLESWLKTDWQRTRETSVFAVTRSYYYSSSMAAWGENRAGQTKIVP